MKTCLLGMFETGLSSRHRQMTNLRPGDLVLINEGDPMFRLWEGESLDFKGSMAVIVVRHASKHVIEVLAAGSLCITWSEGRGGRPRKVLNREE